MHTRRRSTAGLVFIGLPVVLAPLVAAVVTAAVQVDRLAAQSRAIVLEAETMSHQTRSLVEWLGQARRPFLQYQVTGDADFFRIYADRRAAFIGLLDDTLERDLTPAVTETLHELKTQEEALFTAFAEKADVGERAMSAAEAVRLWGDLDDLGRALLDGTSDLIAQHGNTTTEMAAELQRTLLAQAAAVIPASVLLGTLFVLFVTRPMRRIGSAIRRLGAQDFSRAISVRGSSDVEELGRLLEWLRQRILELEEQKATFLRHMSHELKTPLTTIREGADLLVETLSEGAREEAEISRIMRANSLHLQNLIESLLQFSQSLDIKELELSDSVDLEALVREVVANQSLAWEAKRLNVSIETVPTVLRGDAHKIRTILDNMLSNATKYTPRHGRIWLTLRVADNNAIIEVQDTGPGVSESDAQKIFEPFRQGCARYEASVKGTGLGLSIAKMYAEAHDGYIELARSTRGAHFRVGLPIDGPARARGRARDNAHHADDLPVCRVQQHRDHRQQLAGDLPS